MGLIKFLKPVECFFFFFFFFNAMGTVSEYRQYDRSRVLKSKLSYVSSNLWSVELSLAEFLVL